MSAGFLAVSTAFAVENGLFGAGRADRVGTFQSIDQQLVPATAAQSESAPTVAAPRLATPSRDNAPTTTSTASPVASGHADDDGHESDD